MNSKQNVYKLLQNAIEAVGQKGTITISLQPDNDHSVEIFFKGDGPGMPENIRQNIFNLYFTTKAKGTGIGLSMVQRIIFEHGGMISVESEPGKGTRFGIKMPKEVSASG